MKVHFTFNRGAGHRARRTVAVLALVLGAANQALGQSNACDLDANGAVNVSDVNRAVSMALGSTPCTASVEAPNTCTVVTVQRITNAALGQPCLVYSASTRTVNLSWLPSPSAGVTGYNVYRRTTPAGARVRLNSAVVTGTNFSDTSIQLGQTYYYSATAVDSSSESAESTQATAVIPTN